MINVFYRNRNTIGQFMVALMFLGTFGFLFTSDGFVSKSQASGCCGGGEVKVVPFAVDSSGDYSGDIPMDAEATGGCGGGKNMSIFASTSSDCNCLGADKDCGLCDDADGTSSCCNGGHYCPDNTSCEQDEGTCANYCDDDWCSNGSRSSTCSAKGCPG